MTVETLEQNGNQGDEGNSQENPVVALSVKDSSTVKLKTYTVLPGNRPVEASHLKIVSSFNSVGSIRPITSSGMIVSRNMVMSGNRPVLASTLKISETYAVMGNRPVASNEVDDPISLMGYLD